MTGKEELKKIIQSAWNDDSVKEETFGAFLDRAAGAIIQAGWKWMPNRYHNVDEKQVKKLWKRRR